MQGLAWKGVLSGNVTFASLAPQLSLSMAGVCAAISQRCHIDADRANTAAGVKDMKVLKTTQSGYEGFLHDKYTVLKDTRERIVATSITSTWR